MTRVAASKFVGLLGSVLSPAVCKSAMIYLRLGYWPNIRKPRSLNEKVAHRQLFAPHPLGSLLADKWRVREYVAERGLGDILNEVYFVTDDPASIPFDDLPGQFVIKANHGCGWNIIVKDKSELHQRRVIRQCRMWLRRKYGRASHNYETHYDSIAPLILVERFLRDERYELPVDYKIDCFHGRTHSIGVKHRCADITAYGRYDTTWNQLDFAAVGIPAGGHIERPSRLNAMIEAAERLSCGIDYCRVDLYLLNDKDLFFGEITMNPSGGINPISKEWDFRLGELW